MRTSSLRPRLPSYILVACILVFCLSCGCGRQCPDGEADAVGLITDASVIDTKQEDCKKGMMIITHIGLRKHPVPALVLHTALAPWTPEDFEWLSAETLEHLEAAPSGYLGKSLQRDFEVSEEEFRLILEGTKPYLSDPLHVGIPVLSFGVMRELGETTMVFEFYVMHENLDDFYTALVNSFNEQHGVLWQAVIFQAGQAKGTGLWSRKPK
jgi:hypothetical protein